MKRKNSKRLCALLSVLLILALIPVCSFGAETVTVTVDKTEPLDLVEGKIHTDANAVITAKGNYGGQLAVTLTYEWYECDAAGNIKAKVADRYFPDPNIYYQLCVPEELTEGTYYYSCKVQCMEANTSNVVAEGTSDVVTVMVSDGTPVVILDPNGGAFAEIINNTQPLDVELGPDGKVPADYHNIITGMEGLQFVGWFTDSIAGEQVDLSSTVFKHTTRLYAHYDVEKTVTFDANGGYFSKGVTTYEAYFFGDYFAKDKMPADPTRDGYVFAGWYEKMPDGTEQAPVPWGEDGYEFPSNGMIFYAKWDKAEVPESIETEPNEPKQESLDESPAAGDDKDVMPWMMAVGLATLVGSAVSFREKSI